MNINKKEIIYGAFSVIVLLTGCHVPKVTAIKEIEPLPKQYADNGSDTLNIAQLKFDDFFKDKNLLELIDRTLKHNLDYKIADEQIKIAEAYLLSRKGAMLPAIAAGLRVSGTHYGKYTMEGVGNFDTNLSSNIDNDQKISRGITPDYWLGLNASWEADVWGKLGNMKRAGLARYLATTHGKHLLRTAIITQTATLYYELIKLDNEIKILNRNIDLQKQALEIVMVQKEAGRATELAVQQFQAQLMNTEASLYDARQQILSIENQLMALSGTYDGVIVRNETIDIAGINYLQQHGSPLQLLQYRPDILASYLELEATHADAKAARAAFFPIVNLSAYGAFNAFNGSVLFRPASIAYQLLGSITAPIFQQNQLKANFKVVNAQQEISFLNYQKLVINAYQEVKTLLRYIDNNQEILTLKRKEVDALGKSIDISNDLYVTAYASYLEIIAAQKSKLAADLDLIKAQRNQAHILIQLYKTLGGGWE